MKAKKPTTCDRVRALLTGRWLFAHEVQQRLLVQTGELMSESAVTARIRQIRTTGTQVHCQRIVTDKPRWEYKIDRPKKVSNT